MAESEEILESTLGGIKMLNNANIDFSNIDFSQLLEKNMKTLAAIIETAVLSSIRLVKGESLSLKARYIKESEEVMPEMEQEIPIGDGKKLRTVGGDAVRNRKIQEVFSLKDDPRFGNPAVIEAKYCSMMAVPLLFDDKAIGVVQIYTKTPRTFNIAEKDVVTTICDNIAHCVAFVTLINHQNETIKTIEEGIEKIKGRIEVRKNMEFLLAI